MLAPAAVARAQDSIFDSLARAAGVATEVAPPADFVVRSRPAEPLATIPVTRTPDEPPSKVKSEADLKAMDADLANAGRKHDALRSSFAPSAKAMAEAEQKAKSKKKPAAKP